MSSTITTFTNLHPKWGDITCTNDQTFGKVANLMEYVIGGIRGKTIVATGMIAHGTCDIQYLYAPCIHVNLGGKPISIIDNASNKLGKFPCIVLPISSLKLLPCITSKDDATLIAYRDEFENNTLVNTKWHLANTPTARFLIPNFFIIYFGKNTPTGDITLDDVKMRLSKLGTGYDTWVTYATEALSTKHNNDEVFHNTRGGPPTTTKPSSKDISTPAGIARLSNYQNTDHATPSQLCSPTSTQLRGVT